MHEPSRTCRSKLFLSVTFIKLLTYLKFEQVNTFMHNCNIFLYHNLCTFMHVFTSTKLVMKLKLVSLQSGSSPLSNDAISVSIGCIV